MGCCFVWVGTTMFATLSLPLPLRLQSIFVTHTPSTCECQ